MEAACKYSLSLTSFSSNFFVTVVIDRENPVLTSCLTDIVANASPGTSTPVVLWLAPVASDNSDSVSLTVNQLQGGSIAVGSTEVTYTARYGLLERQSQAVLLVEVARGQITRVLTRTILFFGYHRNFCYRSSL